MKYFTASLLASAISARGGSGGPKQGNPNSSISGQHGYGYNMGNDYIGGDNHGQYLGHQDGYEQDTGFYAPKAGDGYTANNVHDHVFGYDTVKSEDDTAWAAITVDQGTLRDAIKVAIEAARLARETYIDGVLQKRRERLQDIHDDNLLKIEAPFDFQLDMLDEEIQDVTKAQADAVQDSTDAYADLISRMDDYQADREEALEREWNKAKRIIDRAVEEGKPVDEVLYAMRLDWLQGVYVGGQTATFDDDVYDKTVFDNEFDMFTFDIGHGKGHGHRTDQQGPGNNRDQGFVTGRGGAGDISHLQGAPLPSDGKKGRYDRQTQNGHGPNLRPSDYEIGLRTSQADGAYRYNQAADLGLVRDSQVPQQSRKKPTYRRGSAPPKRRGPPRRRGPSKRPMKRRPTQKSYRKPTKSYKSRTMTTRPRNPVQKTRQISKRTAYDDYAPMPRGRYY